MNIHLREVIYSSKDGDRFWRMPECYICGNTIKYPEFQMRLLIKFRKKQRVVQASNAIMNTVGRFQGGYFTNRKPAGVGRGSDRDDSTAGRLSKGIWLGVDDGGSKGGGRGKGMAGSKSSGNRGVGRGRG